MRRSALILALALTAGAAAFTAGLARCPRPAAGRCRAAPRMQVSGFPDDELPEDEDNADLPDDMSDEDRERVESARAALLRQFLGGGAADDAPVTPAAAGPPPPPQAATSTTLAAGQVLVANPERFCSRNPFARPVKDMARFGLQGPIVDDGLSPDQRAQMLPVLLLLEHTPGGTSRAVLMERRTGALMGDVSMDDYGCVAISPLWLGGTANQQSLYVVHDADGLAGASAVRDGLWLGGWAAAKPKVSDSSLAEGRFKFFLGSTKWERGGLQAELDDGAWLALDVAPALVIKDRVGEQRPGAPKPMWTELMRLVGAEVKGLVEMVYPEE